MTSRSCPDFKPDTKVLRLYVKWIEQHREHHAKTWAHRYKNDPEAAMCEAMFWGVLQDCDVDVEPGEAPADTRRFPDFRCHKDGKCFYVEVTCLRIDRVANHTGLVHGPSSGGAQSYSNLNSAIFNEVRQKTPQCANLDAPTLVAVGTFHFPASSICVQKHHIENLLTGDSLISWPVDTQTGGMVGKPFLSTQLQQVVQGRKPLPWDEKLWFAGFIKGGAGGLYADFLFAENERFGRSFLASLGGPLASEINAFEKLRAQAQAGQDIGAGALRFGRGLIPGQNLFWTKAAVDYLIFYQLQELANPGYLRRMERGFQSDRKQGFIVKPSRVVPRGSGAPNLGAFFGG